jgi:hypothetical protein
MALLALEEVLFQSFLKRGLILRNFRLAEDSGAGEDRGSVTLERLRVLQLVSLVIILILLDTNQNRLLTHIPGQMAMTATVLQLARMLGRQVLRHWSVLGEIQVLQGIFLFLCLVLPLGDSHPQGNNWFTLYSLGLVVFRAMNAVALAFTITYASRAYFRENSSLFRSNPPMAFSDHWAGKASAAALPFAVASLAAMYLGNIGSPVSRVRTATASALALIAWTAFRTRKAHHPVAHLLTGLTTLALFYVTLSGIPGD